MKFTTLALLAIVGGVSAGKPQLSVRALESAAIVCGNYYWNAHTLLKMRISPALVVVSVCVLTDLGS